MTETNQKSKKPRFKLILIGLVIAAICGLLLEMTQLSIKRLKIQTVIIQNENIPNSFNNAKIFVFSDVRGNVDQLEKVKNLVNKEKPSFIIFLGNLLGETDDHIDLIQKQLKEMDAPMGKYALLSSEDYKNNIETIKETLKNAEFRIKTNEFFNVYHTTPEPIGFAMFDNSASVEVSPNQLVESFPNDSFLLAFAHDPDIIDILSPSVHTLVAGKTEHGKVRLPLLGSVIDRDAHINKHEIIHDVSLRLTAGVGTSSPEIRLSTNPDVMIIQLKSSQ